jgi:hypothetical protein
MGKFKHDGSKVDTSKGGAAYAGEQPKNGVYPAKLVLLEDHTSSEGNEGFHWVFEITEGEYAGWRGHRYSNDDSTAWVTDQILVALGLIEPGGSFDGTHEQVMKKGGPVRLKTRSETYEDERRAKVQFVLPPTEGQALSNGAAKKAKKDKKKDAEPF